jgi:hypothetical protein
VHRDRLRACHHYRVARQQFESRFVVLTPALNGFEVFVAAWLKQKAHRDGNRNHAGNCGDESSGGRFSASWFASGKVEVPAIGAIAGRPVKKYRQLMIVLS